MSTKRITRREMLGLSGSAVVGGVLALKDVANAEISGSRPAAQDSYARDTDQKGELIVPDGSLLAWHMVGEWKVFHLICEEVEHEFAPGLKATCWGFNGSVHGPVLEAFAGDKVRIFVTNRLTAATSIHWHGLLIPNGMDGVGGLNQKAIRTGETFKYEFTLKQSGTCMYHAHHDEMTQIAMGMVGMFVIHPRVPEGPVVDRDFAIMLHEWRIDPGTARPNPNEMTDFNILTMNARCFPGTSPLVARKGDRVRVRFGNLGPMDHHPIHLHGYQFMITETDGGRLPESARRLDTTVLVPVGTTRTIEFVADEPGDWAFHCHMTHHVMNQMAHGMPNMIGVSHAAGDKKIRKLLPDYMTMGGSGMADMAEMGMAVPANSISMVGGRGKHDYITMGGMFTILKVREQLDSYSDPGWYESPPGTQAELASDEDLKVNGIVPAKL